MIKGKQFTIINSKKSDKLMLLLSITLSDFLLFCVEDRVSKIDNINFTLNSKPYNMARYFLFQYYNILSAAYLLTRL